MYVRELVVQYRRRLTASPHAGKLVKTPAEAAAVLADLIGEEAVEVFGVLCLNTRHRLLAYHQVSRGGISATFVSPREVFQAAFLGHAASLVLCHNHPSGDPTPSPDDRALTHRLVNAGMLIGVEIVDHIIIGHGGYYSFKEGGELR